MICVDDIISLPVFDRIQLACPCEGSNARLVTNCGTLDYEPFFDDYSVFVPGEFIFTTLGFAEADPALAEEAVCKILDRGIAALAIKPVALKKMTPKMAAASKSTGVPIFFYEGRYLERIITEAMNLIDRDAEASKRTSLVDALLSPSDGDQVRNLMFQISGATGAAAQCIALEAERADEASSRALLNATGALLQDYASRFSDVESTDAMLYRDAILGFISFSRPPQTIITIAEADLEGVVRQINGIHCGISQESPLEESDLCIRQALAALRTAREEDAAVMRWSALRLDAFHAAASTDRLFFRTSKHIYDLLDEHDRIHGSALRETADAYALSFGDVKATAESLFQHPNTIRYRIKKVKEATGCASLTDKELAAVLIMARIAQGRI